MAITIENGQTTKASSFLPAEASEESAAQSVSAWTRDERTRCIVSSDNMSEKKRPMATKAKR